MPGILRLTPFAERSERTQISSHTASERRLQRTRCRGWLVEEEIPARGDRPSAPPDRSHDRCHDRFAARQDLHCRHWGQLLAQYIPWQRGNRVSSGRKAVPPRNLPAPSLPSWRHPFPSNGRPLPPPREGLQPLAPLLVQKGRGQRAQGQGCELSTLYRRKWIAHRTQPRRTSGSFEISNSQRCHRKTV